MRFCAGETYKEAIAFRPITGMRDNEIENIKRLLEFYPVVLDFKEVAKGERKFSWRYCGPYCYCVYDEVEGRFVTHEHAPERIKYFKSIRRAMEWIYDHNKEFYDSIPNLSTKKTEGEEGTTDEI